MYVFVGIAKSAKKNERFERKVTEMNDVYII